MKRQVKVLNKGKSVLEVASMATCCKGVPTTTK
jgi:hypothetical protein